MADRAPVARVARCCRIGSGFDDAGDNGVTHRKRDVDILYRSLSRHGFEAAALHGDMPQPKRTETLERFKNGEIRLQVTPGGIGQFEVAFAAALRVSGVAFHECVTIAILYSVLRYTASGLFYAAMLWRRSMLKFSGIIKIIL